MPLHASVTQVSVTILLRASADVPIVSADSDYRT